MAAGKKPKAEQVTSAQPPAISWWKKPWVGLATFIAALALLLTNINSIFVNVRALPSEARKTSDQFFEWYGEYPAWKGHWTNNPEGYVDAEEMNLSDEDFRITIDETKDGAIAGTIETKGICEKVPIFEFLLIDGIISSASRAEINVFDYVGGYRRDFARLTLRRDGYVMTVIPDEDPAGLLGKETRIALDPNELGTVESQEPICGGKSLKLAVDIADEIAKQQAAKKAAK